MLILVVFVANMLGNREGGCTMVIVKILYPLSYTKYYRLTTSCLLHLLFLYSNPTSARDSRVKSVFVETAPAAGQDIMIKYMHFEKSLAEV